MDNRRWIVCSRFQLVMVIDVDYYLAKLISELGTSLHRTLLLCRALSSHFVCIELGVF